MARKELSSPPGMKTLYPKAVVGSLAAPARPAQVAAQHDQLLAAIADGRGADAGRIARQHALDTRASTHQEG